MWVQAQCQYVEKGWVYVHLMKSVNQEAPARLENAIFEPNGSKRVAKTEKGVMANAVTP